MKMIWIKIWQPPCNYFSLIWEKPIKTIYTIKSIKITNFNRKDLSCNLNEMQSEHEGISLCIAWALAHFQDLFELFRALFWHNWVEWKSCIPWRHPLMHKWLKKNISKSRFPSSKSKVILFYTLLISYFNNIQSSTSS